MAPGRATRKQPIRTRPTRRSGPVTADSIAYLGGWSSAPTGSATREEAVSYPPYDRCLDLIAGSLANLELQAGTDDPATGVWSRLADQPAYLIDPDPANDAWQWRYATVRDLAEYGNHVELLGDLDYRTLRPGWGVPVHPVDVAALVDDDTRELVGWMVREQRYTVDEVLHIKRGGLSGEPVSAAPVERYAKSLGTAVTAEEWAGRYLSGGGLPPAIIQVPGTVGKESMVKFKADWRTMLATGEALVLPSNVTVVPLVSDAQKQQLVEARQWNAHMACIATGVPAYKLGLEGPSMTYQNVETADIAFRVDTLERYAQPIAHAVSKHLLPRGQRARWQWAQVERADIRTQVEVAAALVASNLLEVDEARQRLQYPPKVAAVVEGSTPEGVPDLGAQEV